MSSPIPADHISNTNPLLGSGSGALPAAAEAELLELHSKLAFHGRRMFRHEVHNGIFSVAQCSTLLGRLCCRWSIMMMLRSHASSQRAHACALCNRRLIAVLPFAILPHHPRYQVAATAWRLQFADHWQGHEAGGRSGDELRLAVAHLRAMLADEDEIRWRRCGVLGLVSGRGCGHDMTANGIVCMQ